MEENRRRRRLWNCGIVVEFEIDTGQGKTVISESLYKEKLNNVELEPTKLVLKNIFEGNPKGYRETAGNHYS